MKLTPDQISKRKAVQDARAALDDALAAFLKTFDTSGVQPLSGGGGTTNPTQPTKPAGG